MKVKIKPFQKRLEAMKLIADPYRVVWEDIKKVIKPTRGNFTSSQNPSRAIDFKTLISGHASRAVTIGASGMMAGHTSPANKWFKFQLHDKDLMKYKPVKQYFEDIEDIMFSIYARSNTYDIFYNTYEELLSFATSASLELKDYKDVIRGRMFTAGEYYLAQSSTRRIDTFARQYSTTVANLVEDFGLENVSKRVKNLYEKNVMDESIRCNHIIEPNVEKVEGIVDKFNMPFRSIYWEDSESDGESLDVGGFEEFPVLTARWNTVSASDVYAVGPGWEALGDTNMLQKMKREQLMATAMVIKPPTIIDASVEGEANLLPGGITRSSSLLTNAGVRSAYQINPDLPAMRQIVEDCKSDIDKAFFTDVFLAISNSSDTTQRTAREIAERYSEKLLMLGPIVNKLNNEFLNHKIDRDFAIINRAGLFPEPPEELQGMNIEIEYISTLAQAQKMVGINSIQEWTNFVAVSSQVMPEMLNVVNQEEVAIVMAEKFGLSPRVTYSPEEIAQTKKAKQEAQMAAQKGQAMLAATQGAKNLADADMSGDTALTRLMGQKPKE